MCLSEVLLPVHCLQAAYPLGNTLSIAHTLTQLKQLINTGYLVSSPTYESLHDTYHVILPAAPPMDIFHQ